MAFSALTPWQRRLAWLATWCLLTGLVFAFLPAPKRHRSAGTWVINMVPFTPSSFELLAAAARGDATKIRQLADRLEPVNTPLLLDEIVAWRLESRLAELAHPSPGGLTALHLAAHHGHLETVRALLELGADPDIVQPGRSNTSSGPVTALGIAAARNDEPMVRLLLDWDARVVPKRELRDKLAARTADSDPSDARGWTSSPELSSLLADALERERADDRMRDEFARPSTKVARGTAPSVAEAQQVDHERWAASRNAPMTPSEKRLSLAWSAWLHPESGKFFDLASDWAVDALREGDASRAEFTMHRWVLQHPILLAAGPLKAGLAEVPEGSRYRLLLAALHAEESSDLSNRRYRHPQGKAARKQRVQAQAPRLFCSALIATAVTLLVWRVTRSASGVSTASDPPRGNSEAHRPS